LCSWGQAQGFLGRPGRGWGVRAGHVARLGRATRRPRPPAGATLAPTGRPALPSPAQDSQQRHAGLGWNHWGTAVGVRHPNATVVGRCQTPLATVPPTRAISAGGSDTCGNLTCMPHRCQTPHAHRFFKHDRAPGVSDTCQLSTRYPKSTYPRSCEPGRAGGAWAASWSEGSPRRGPRAPGGAPEPSDVAAQAPPARPGASRTQLPPQRPEHFPPITPAADMATPAATSPGARSSTPVRAWPGRFSWAWRASPGSRSCAWPRRPNRSPRSPAT